MSVSKDHRLDLKYLLQQDLIDKFIPCIGKESWKESWQIVYTIDDKRPDSFAVFSALLEPKAAKEALEKDN